MFQVCVVRGLVKILEKLSARKCVKSRVTDSFLRAVDGVKLFGNQLRKSVVMTEALIGCM